MTSRKYWLAAICLGLTMVGCGRSEPGPSNVVAWPKKETGPDPRIPPDEQTPSLDEQVTKGVTFLDQHWTPEETVEFYSLPHGSQLMPYSWIPHLEQVGKQEPFFSDANMRRFRFLPQQPRQGETISLPVGFVKDADLDWVGLNCAACHTTQINYQGKGIRMDGKPALHDTDSFLRELTAALAQCQEKPEVFDRFAANLLGKRQE